MAGPVAAQGLPLTFATPVLSAQNRSEAPGSYALPVAAFDGTTVPARRVDGAVDQSAYRLDAPGVTTLALLQPLRAQLEAAGFTVIFECASAACGGFDFRFGTDVMPEPDMHVDMGDYRFLSAERGTEVVSLLVSRSSFAGFVQVTSVGSAKVSPELSENGKVAALGTAITEARPELAAAADDRELTAFSVLAIGDALEKRGSVVLDDLVFASGSIALQEGRYASLQELAAWLKANPDRTIALVGHTDASGSLALNVALSRERAEAVMQRLITEYGLPPAQLAADGVGFLAPRTSNLTEEGRQKNRRVEAILTSTR